MTKAKSVKGKVPSFGFSKKASQGMKKTPTKYGSA